VLITAPGQKQLSGGVLVRAVLMGLAVLTCLAGLAAQQRNSASDNSDVAPAAAKSSSFELAKENSSRVAASAQQIRQVLVKDPGLLVELKQRVSEEVTSHGQVVDDQDLTDQAIFDRLDGDVVFRSEATRLLQRYGHLLPTVNPESELGKQQELLLKERARMLVQIEAQEDAQATQRPPGDKVQRTNEDAEECDSRRETNCGQYTRPREKRNDRELGPPTNRKIPTPNSPLPDESTSVSPLLRAGAIPGPVDTERFDSPSDLMRLSALASSRELGSARSALGMERPTENLSATIGGLDLRSLRDTAAPTGPSRPIESNPRIEDKSRRYFRGENERISPQDAILHTQNPYRNIPSLYDLYVQVPAKGRAPERFGIDILNGGMREPDAVPMDLPVGPDYVVGPGDSLAIELWGGISQRISRTVDREGRISLPESGPLLVSGRTLGDVQFTVQQALRSQFRDTSADVSLSRLRTVRIYVVGEVGEPGAYDISSLSTPLNAIVAAGGVSQRGSLRFLKHFRGKELVEVVDAYDLLLGGVGLDQKRLENGDSLLVPTAGPQVTVEGMVRRPAIYELKGETTLEDALELAGGVLPAAALQHVEVERLVAHQKRTMLSLDLSPEGNSAASAEKLSSFHVRDGDSIHIFPIAPYNDQAVYLQGHVLRPGRYSYREGMKFGDLVSSYSDLLPEPAGKYAEIIRLEPPDFRPTVESFELTAALANPDTAPKLMPLDTVRIFSRFDFEPAPDVWVGGEVRSPGLYLTSGQVRLRDAVFLAGGVTSDADLDSAQLFRASKDGKLRILSVNLSGALSGDVANNLLLEAHDRVLIHRNSAKVDPATVYVKGEVAKPGRYPLTSDMRVGDLIRVAGGLKRSADSQDAILTHQERDETQPASTSIKSIDLAPAMGGVSSSNPTLNNGDVLTIRRAPGWDSLGASVTIRGEVEHPGTYGIRPGDSLATVLASAGGFTNEAYPYGAILTRREVRDLEIKSHDELVARVQSEETQLKTLPENDADQKNAKLTAIAQTETTLTQLQTNLPIGRVVIHTSPDGKEFAKSAANTPLRNGDTIVIPKKANYVLVNGQVFNSTAVGYVAQRSAKWYLGQAGGFTQLADKNAVFVIRANGSILAAKNNGSRWSGDPLSSVLLPGDAIIVPEKAPNIGTRNWLPLIQAAQVATSVVLAVAYLKP
jgi:protein involved in polysaccharide export with SLBB domain